MNPHGSISVVRRWHGLRPDHVRGCFGILEELNNKYLPSGCGPRVRKLANNLRLGNVVLSHDLSGVWVSIGG
jgi:hypothetical protein